MLTNRELRTLELAACPPRLGGRFCLTLDGYEPFWDSRKLNLEEELSGISERRKCKYVKKVMYGDGAWGLRLRMTGLN